MEQKILDELLRTTFTLDSFRKRYQVLKRKIEGEIYSQGTSIKPPMASLAFGGGQVLREEGGADDSGGLRAEGGINKGEEWLENFDQGLLSQVKNDDFVKLNQAVEEFLKNTQAMSIYFVFMPDEAQIKDVGTWLRGNLKNPRLIFEAKVDPDLIGGCAIAYKGVYKDYSLKAKIAGNKEQLMEEFRKYFKQ